MGEGTSPCFCACASKPCILGVKGEVESLDCGRRRQADSGRQLGAPPLPFAADTRGGPGTGQLHGGRASHHPLSPFPEGAGDRPAVSPVACGWQLVGTAAWATAGDYLSGAKERISPPPISDRRVGSVTVDAKRLLLAGHSRAPPTPPRLRCISSPFPHPEPRNQDGERLMRSASSETVVETVSGVHCLIASVCTGVGSW